MKVFSYIRVSGVGQVDKDGPIRQAESITAFCSRHGLQVLAEFKEEGVSGTVDGMDRPKFADMISRIDLFKMANEPLLQVDAIVVERMDRLARDLMVSEFLLRECRQRGIKVFCADQGELVDMASENGDPTRTMLRQILGAIAQWDKSVTVKKLRAARQRQRLEGHPCEGRKPYGFHAPEKKILEIAKQFRASGLSYEKIAYELNSEGYRTREGKQWTKANLFSVVTGRGQKERTTNYARRIQTNGVGKGVQVLGGNSEGNPQGAMRTETGEGDECEES